VSRRFSVSLLTAVLTAVLLLSACGGDDGNDVRDGASTSGSGSGSASGSGMEEESEAP
jgi:hypothetical protein